MPDEDLAVAGSTRADADRRDLELVRHPGGDRLRHRLEDEREAARRFERTRVADESVRPLGRPALRLEAAEHGRRLRRQPQVPHDADPRADDRLRARERRPRPFELDDVRARLLDEADRVPDRVLVGDLVRAEGHVADDERPAGAAGDGARHEEHLVHRHRHRRRLVPEHDHRGRVPDEDQAS